MKGALVMIGLVLATIVFGSLFFAGLVVMSMP